MAERYWNPSGNANWTDANCWALTDGGTANQATPTSLDNVHFTSTNVYNCTLSSAADTVCNDLSFTGGTGYTGNFTLSTSATYNLMVYGSMTLYSGMTWTSVANSYIYFYASSGSYTITTAGKTIARIYMGPNSASTATWTLQDALTVTSAIYFRSGTFNTNGQTISCFSLDLYAYYGNTRTLTLGASQITCSGVDGFMVYNNGNTTLNANTSKIILTANGNFYGNGLTYNEVQFNGTQHSIRDGSTFGTFTRTSTNTLTDNLIFYANQTITGTLNITGYSTVRRPLIQSDTIGTQRTLTLTGATRNYSNCDFQDIRFTNGTDGTVSIVGDCGGNTGITTRTPTTLYWKGASATYTWDDIAQWWTQSNGQGSNNQTPLPQDVWRYDSNSFSSTRKTVTPVAGLRVGGLNFQGCTQTPTLGTTAFTMYGSLTCGTMTITSTSNAITLSGRGSYTITLVAARDRNITIDAYNGTYTFQDTFELGTLGSTRCW